jgi:hypothetical protein
MSIKTGDVITTTNRFTGRAHTWEVASVSKKGTKITVLRPDWKTGVMELFLKPSHGIYENAYSGELLRA